MTSETHGGITLAIDNGNRRNTLFAQCMDNINDRSVHVGCSDIIIGSNG